jgi:hypothetical protein
LAKEGIAFEALDNGILSCADPPRLQQLCDSLSGAKIDALLRKWLARLPHPFTDQDRKAGYRYDLSILLGRVPEILPPGQMTYHLRRLRLHGLIERVPKTHRYRVTDSGWRTALFCTPVYSRVLRPGLAQVVPKEAQDDFTLRRQFDRLDQAISAWIEEQKVPA